MQIQEICFLFKELFYGYGLLTLVLLSKINLTNILYLTLNKHKINLKTKINELKMMRFEVNLQ